MGAGWRDVLRTRSDSCAQPVSLVKQKRKTAHRRPRCGGGGNQHGGKEDSGKKSVQQSEWETTNKTLWPQLVNSLKSTQSLY